MDPTSGAEAILSTFHVVYLTTRFIYNEILRAKGFRKGRANMAHKYRLEILRLKAFWMILTQDVGTTTNINSLNGLPKVRVYPHKLNLKSLR